MIVESGCAANGSFRAAFGDVPSDRDGNGMLIDVHDGVRARPSHGGEPPTVAPHRAR